MSLALIRPVLIRKSLHQINFSLPFLSKFFNATGFPFEMIKCSIHSATFGWILWNLLGSSESHFLCCSAGVPGSKPYWQLRVFHACIFLCQQGCRRLFLGWIGVIPFPIACPLLSIPLLGKVRSLSYLCGFSASLSMTDPDVLSLGH